MLRTPFNTIDNLRFSNLKYLFFINLNISIIYNLCFAQIPVDSLKKQDVFFKSSAISLIKYWQSISHKTPLLDCPFENYCSQYSIDSFKNRGLIIGTFKTTNRLIRCNPLALFCYLRNENGYLIDDSDNMQYSITESSKRSAPLTGFMYFSSIIPGLHKLLLGKWSDSIFTSGIIIYGYYKGTKRIKENSNLHGGITLSITTIIYLSDIYWSIDKITNYRRTKKKY